MKKQFLGGGWVVPCGRSLLGSVIRDILASCVLLFACTSCATATSGSVDDPAPTASISVLAEGPEVLTLLLSDARGFHRPLTFTRTCSQSPAWNWAGDAFQPGVTFGRSTLSFAGLSRLRRLGISSEEAVQSLSPTIATRTMTDLSVAVMPGGELAIALWQGSSITEVWVAGSMVTDVLDDPTLAGMTYSERSLELCCRSVQNPAGGAGQPNRLPHPHLANCMAAARLSDGADLAQVCDCLNSACEICFAHPQYCCGDPALPPAPCATPWLLEESAGACAMHTELCEPGSPTAPTASQLPAYLLLDEVGNRLQARIDLQGAGSTES